MRAHERRVSDLRPITGTVKHGAFQIVGGTIPFYHCYVYTREVEEGRSSRSGDCWFGLARKYRARYAVIDSGFDHPPPVDDFVQVWGQSKWSLWRRSEARARYGLPDLSEEPRWPIRIDEDDLRSRPSARPLGPTKLMLTSDTSNLSATLVGTRR